MKGVILAGGKGTRLLPATSIINKHLIPILNKPMILYSLETLKRFGISKIVIVTGGGHIGSFAEFLGNGSLYGVDITYRVQTEAGGIAQALSLTEDYIGLDENFCVILGDNIFDANVNSLLVPENITGKTLLFTKTVSDPERFGVLMNNSIIEKPDNPSSYKVITGLYIYPVDVFNYLKNLSPSSRGELEITDVNNWYLQQKRAIVTDLGDCFWSDAGTPESLARATAWVLKSLSAQ